MMENSINPEKDFVRLAIFHEYVTAGSGVCASICMNTVFIHPGKGACQRGVPPAFPVVCLLGEEVWNRSGPWG